VEISVNGNFVQYHVSHNKTEVWVVDDFNRVNLLYIRARFYRKGFLRFLKVFKFFKVFKCFLDLVYK